MNTPIKNISFLSKTLCKNSIFQKTSFHFHFFTQFEFYCEEFWESTYKSPCSSSHTSFKAYKIFCNYSKRRIVQGYLLGVEKRCTRNCLLGVEKSCTNLIKIVCQLVYKERILGVQNQDKENLKRVAWGLDVGHEDRTRIKSLLFAFA